VIVLTALDTRKKLVVLQRHLIHCNVMLHPETDVTGRNTDSRADMSVLIDGIPYFSATEITKELAVSRQTLWRWRRDGKIPAGHRYRSGQVLFSPTEFEAIRAHANLLEPIQSPNKNQLKLFNGGGKV